MKRNRHKRRILAPIVALFAMAGTGCGDSDTVSSSSCGANTELVAGSCRPTLSCGLGTVSVNGVCTGAAGVQSCGAGTVRDAEDRCIVDVTLCGDGMTLEGGICLAPSSAECGPGTELGMELGMDGEDVPTCLAVITDAICNVGTSLSDQNECEALCGAGEVFNSMTEGCDSACATGTVFDAVTGTCAAECQGAEYFVSGVGCVHVPLCDEGTEEAGGNCQAWPFDGDSLDRMCPQIAFRFCEAADNCCSYPDEVYINLEREIIEVIEVVRLAETLKREVQSFEAEGDFIDCVAEVMLSCEALILEAVVVIDLGFMVEVDGAAAELVDELSTEWGQCLGGSQAWVDFNNGRRVSSPLGEEQFFSLVAPNLELGSPCPDSEFCISGLCYGEEEAVCTARLPDGSSCEDWDDRRCLTDSSCMPTVWLNMLEEEDPLDPLSIPELDTYECQSPLAAWSRCDRNEFQCVEGTRCLAGYYLDENELPIDGLYTCVPVGQLDEACMRETRDCREGLVCACHEGDIEGACGPDVVCRELAGVGDFCSTRYADMCNDSTYCDADTFECTTKKIQNQFCAATSECQDGLVCRQAPSSDDFGCLQPLVEDDACGIWDEAFCAEGLWCDPTASEEEGMGECRPILGEGEACLAYCEWKVRNVPMHGCDEDLDCTLDELQEGEEWSIVPRCLPSPSVCSFDETAGGGDYRGEDTDAYCGYLDLEDR